MAYTVCKLSKQKTQRDNEEKTIKNQVGFCAKCKRFFVTLKVIKTYSKAKKKMRSLGGTNR